ncbi:mitoguardin 2 [Latimeria chalumnae]|uniref:mitoguardin 2 n=1 Tax=Latimeria chalumnae TaxID=7897 RepID=UPI00313B1288
MSLRGAEGMSIIQALAMTVAEIPVFLYSAFGQSIFSQLRLSPSLKKVLFATALGSVALALTAHHLKRRRRRRKQIAEEKDAQKPRDVAGHLLPAARPTPVKKGSSKRVQSPSCRSNDTLSGISSIAPSKHSSSSHSLASVHAGNFVSPVATPVGVWEASTLGEESGMTEDSNAENLYILGMELFEEALLKWEQALNIRQHRGSDMGAKMKVIQPGASGDSVSEQEFRNKDFAQKLEGLLHRAYHLQEEFGVALPPESLMLDFENEGTLALPLSGSSERLYLDDEASVTSEDSFFSAAELFESLQFSGDSFQPAKPAALYEEALGLVRDRKVDCRTLRTEVLGCYNDQDFLAKLHCVRQAFQVLLEDESQRLFFSEIGKEMITGLMTKAGKSPKGFLESYQEMLRYTVKEETWPTTQRELEGRGVVCMNFFDIILDFILMDAFDDLESPPSSVVAVLRNRWLSDSFKETALATACWSVLKAKRRLLLVPDGFISHFYSISEHVSPVLAFGFLGPKPQLCEICTFFKQQIVQYLKDVYDLDQVRYTTVQSLADDILQLSQRRSEILLGYLGTEAMTEMNGTVLSGNGALDHN